jgi:hypothetical protein
VVVEETAVLELGADVEGVDEEEPHAEISPAQAMIAPAARIRPTLMLLV